MKFSESWLREWINLPITHTALVNQLSMAGFQVEESKPVTSNIFHGIVVGKIIDCKIHPNLDKTWIIKINNGDKHINVICDNINCKKNIKIVVANIGAILPDGKTVTSSVIQGKKSEGVLCTFSMLQLNNYTNKIIKLPPDAPIGYNFYDYLSFNDNIIDINIPYNRGDCFSIIGLAREIASINQLKLRKIKIKTFKSNITDTIPIIIEDSNKCSKFSGRIIKDVNVFVSTPLNIQEKLYRCGISPINVVIDIMHYILLELGQPIHVFDYDKIDHDIIYVRLAKHGETLTLYDNQVSLKLLTNTLIIADHYKPLSIAGIVIGNESMVSFKTRNIFLQSAIFNPSDIARESRLYNLNTISSVRYERGVDSNLSELALNYATSLLLKICHGKSGPIINAVNNDLNQPKIIILNRLKLDAILGFHIKKTEVTCILKNLGFHVKTYNTYWKVLIPTWRSNITIEENLISEVIRIYGYNKIPKIPFKTFLTKPQYTQINTFSLSRVKTILIDRGYQEVITYSFVNAYIQKLLYPQYTPLTLKNPISSDMAVMRLSLWPGLIKTVIYNQKRQQKHIKLFESGICFFPQKTVEHITSQKLMIAGIQSGFKRTEHWKSITSPIIDFYDIKGDIESILNILNQCNNQIVFKNCTHSALHPNKSAVIYLNNVLIGYIGMIHPMIHTQLGLKLNTFVFELSWDILSKFKLPIKITSISKFPKNYRDLSLIVPNHIPSADIINTCKKLNIPQLIEIKLIDIYVGDNIPKGFKSFTIKLTLQSNQYTLKEEEILKIVNTCIITLKNNYQAILR